jgi:hypothetical protein
MDDYLKANHTYDLTKNITDIEVNTGFILGLDAILMYYFTNIVEDPTTLPAMFRKFGSILGAKDEKEITVELDYIERQIYTLFTLQQLLKVKAKEQNLIVPVKSEVTKQDLADYMKAIMNSDDKTAMDKLEKLESLLKTEKESS